MTPIPIAADAPSTSRRRSTTSTRRRTWATRTRRSPPTSWRATTASAARTSFFLTGTDEHGEPVADAAQALGLEPRELADRNAERFKALAPLLSASNDFFIRTTDPRARRGVQEVLPAVLRQRLRLRGDLRGLVLPPLRGLQGRERDRRGQPVPDPPHRARRASRRRTTSSSSRRSRSRLERALRRAARLRHPARPLQRGALVHPQRPARRVADARQAHVGRPGAVGPGARLLRLVRRAAELLHGARLRARRRGPDRAVLAGDLPPDRQGHPALPRRLLAGAADGGRAAAARARLRPRLPADGRGAR